MWGSRVWEGLVWGCGIRGMGGVMIGGWGRGYLGGMMGLR